MRLLIVEHLSASVGEIQLVEDVCFHLDSAEAVAIIGASGRGRARWQRR